MDDFAQIYRLWFRDVYRYAMTLTGDPQQAEEITEETFFRALRALDSFRGECELRIWLCRIARNVFYREQKRKKRFSPRPAQETEQPDPADPFAPVEDRSQAEGIRKLLLQIPEPYREVFTLRVLGERSFGEIGALFGKSAHWACVTYHRARGKIQEKMEEHR